MMLISLGSLENQILSCCAFESPNASFVEDVFLNLESPSYSILAANTTQKLKMSCKSLRFFLVPFEDGETSNPSCRVQSLGQLSFVDP